MQHVVIRRPGGFDRLEFVEAETPSPKTGHALIRTASIGVNFADCVVRLGLYPSAKEYVGWPITPGFEFSGVIESLGDAENPGGFQTGDEVYGVTLFGAYSSHLNVPYACLYRVPKGVTLRQAGAIPTAALTALYALDNLAGVKPGYQVLIHSAAGGVGSTMVQMAKALGAHVVGVVGSTEKVAFVKELGADSVIDKSRENVFKTARDLVPQGYDVVLDANGATSIRGSYAVLSPTGRLIIYGMHTMLPRGKGTANWLKLIWDYLRTPRFDPMALINENKSVMGFNLSYLFSKQDLLDTAMARISAWYAEGALRLPQLTEYSLKDASLAHAALQSGSTLGKLTLVPPGEGGAQPTLGPKP